MKSLIVIVLCFLCVFFKVLFWNNLCKEVCVPVAVNNHACCIWIVNGFSDCNTCLFSLSVFFFDSVFE